MFAGGERGGGQWEGRGCDRKRASGAILMMREVFCIRTLSVSEPCCCDVVPKVQQVSGLHQVYTVSSQDFTLGK